MQYNNNYSGRKPPGNQYDYFDSFDNNYEEPVFDDEFAEEEKSSYGRRYPQQSGGNDRYGRSSYWDDRYSSVPKPPNKGKSSGRKTLNVFLILLFLINLGVLGYVIIDHTYAFIGKGIGNIYPVKVNTTELDLSDKKVNDFEGLSKLDKLQTLDLRGLDISVKKYEYIRTLVPADCRIFWNILIGGHSFDSSSSTVSFSDASAAELDSLKYFDDLKKVNASGCKQYSSLKKLALENPECDISWVIPIGEKTYPSSLTEFKLTNEITAEQTEALQYFPWLVYIDATEYTDFDNLLKLNTDLPYCDISWKINLAGVSVNSSETDLNLSGKNIGNLEDFKQKLSYLPKLKNINMCDCNLNNDQMASLCSAHPDKKFVWYITFGDPNIKTWKVRTDITAFSTLNPSGGTPYTQEDFAPLFLYCTDLVAIDLGHNCLSNISMIANLKKLKYIILADNDIVDLTPIGTLEDLEYLEIFNNKISDVTPLHKLKKLYDLDLTSNYITDVTQFFPMKNLLSLELDNTVSKDRNVISQADFNKLSAALPNCYIVRVQEDAYRYAKNNVRFLAMKLAFNNQDSVVYYNGWEDIKFKPSFYGK